MTPKDLMNEKKLSILEEAAKMFTHIHYIDEIYPSEIKDIVSDMEQSFIDGANWQKSNLWFDIKESITISFLVNPCKFNIEMNSNIAKVRVTHWMLIPEFNIKT